MPDTFRPGTSRAPRGTRSLASPTSSRTATSNPGAYTGPELRWTQRIRDALAPVSHELGDVRRFVLRRLAHEVGRQLDAGISSERMAARIHARYRNVMRADIRDIGAWLLAVGIRHKGCGVPSCEDGYVWPTGEPCEICAHHRQVTRAQWRQARDLEARLQQLRAERQAAEAHGAHVDEEQLALPGLPGERRLPGAVVLPPKKTYRQRDAATDGQVRAAIATHGPEVALHIYGHLRVLPLLSAPSETGNDRRTHAQ